MKNKLKLIHYEVIPEYNFKGLKIQKIKIRNLLFGRVFILISHNKLIKILI